MKPFMVGFGIGVAGIAALVGYAWIENQRALRRAGL